MNQIPEREYLSKDRWNVWEIKESNLVRKDFLAPAAVTITKNPDPKDFKPLAQLAQSEFPLEL